MAAPSTPQLYRLIDALKEMRLATGNDELQSQTMLTFLYIATRHPNEVAMKEVEDNLKLGQTSTSRNFAYLSKGNAKMMTSGRKGYGLIAVTEDPHYRKRLLARLTSKGLALAEELKRVLEAQPA